MYCNGMSVTRRVRRFSGGVCPLGLQGVWCSKCRHPVLGGRIAAGVDELIRKKSEERDWRTVVHEVVPVRVRLFVEHEPMSSASYVTNRFKGSTSQVLRSECPHLTSRIPTLWSTYFAASVGAVSAATATAEKYSNTQREDSWTMEARS